MKNTIKATLIAAAIAGIATSAQAAYPSSDLIIGFTLQTGNDFEFDLGTVGSLVNGETWDLSGSLGGLNSSSVKWGVVGSDEDNEIAYVTKTGAAPGSLTESHWGNTDNAVKAIGSLFATSGPGTSTAPSSGLANSWNMQTVSGALTTQYHNAYVNPNSTGYSTINFYSIVGDGTTPAPAATLAGTFSFANNGVVTFDAVSVPEPSTYGLFAAAGVLLVGLRNQFRRKQA